MSEIPLEYKVMKKKFFKSVQKSLGDDLVGIIVYGGAASERLFSGVSDIDFFIILKSIKSLSKPLSAVYELLSKEILGFLENPLFASLLDYDIYVEDQLPKDGNFNGFSPIRALALKTGELLVGKNPFEGLTIEKSDLKSGARKMVQEYLEKLSSLMFMPNFDIEPKGKEVQSEQESLVAEKEFLAVDAILSSAQAYQMLSREKYVTMPDIVQYAETEPIDGVDNELIRIVSLLRQGIEADNTDIYSKAIDFCGSIIKLLEGL